MDIYSFIDSQAIREHLQKLDYRFNAVEAAFLIWQSRKRSLEEKLSAWQEIMETAAEDEVLLNRQKRVEVSLQNVLGNYMDRVKKAMENFQDGKDCIYFYEYETDSLGSHEYETMRWWTERSERGFRDYQSCCDDFRRMVEVNYPEEDSKKHLWYPRIVRYDLAGESRGKAFVNMRIQMTVLESTAFDDWDEIGPESDFDDLCLGLCIDIPTPFCRGDLVCHSDGKPFVLNYINTWDLEKRLENRFSKEEAEQGDKERTWCFLNGDPAGMLTHGYEMCENFGVWDDELGFSEYLDLEYYEGPLEGKEQALKLISEYLKGSCDLELLLNGYAFGLLDGKQKQLLKKYHNDYTKSCGSFWGWRPEGEGKSVVNLRRI